MTMWLAWVIRLARSDRSATGTHRHQLMWVSAGPHRVIGLIPELTVNGTSTDQTIEHAAGTLLVCALPVSMGIAIARYRLYEINRLIGRFNRACYDADAMVTAFVPCLRGALDLEAVEPELITTVQRGLEPTHPGTWVRRPGSVAAV